jgi:hypothetical protein
VRIETIISRSKMAFDLQGKAQKIGTVLLAIGKPG